MNALAPEATLALATCARDVTGRVTYSLSLLAELARPVRTLDGGQLLEGGQRKDFEAARLRAGYLADR